MPGAQFALTTLAVFSHLLSASAQCSTATVTINSQSDAAALKCSTFTGDITIAAGVGGSIHLDGIQKIQGSLKCQNNEQLTQIRARSLESVSNGIVFGSLDGLSDVSFPALASVGRLSLSDLGNLTTLSFPNLTQVQQDFTLSDTTVRSLDGFNVEALAVGSLYIADNENIKAVQFGFSNVTGDLTVEGNSWSTSVAFPNLTYAGTFTVGSASSFEAPKLSTTHGQFYLHDNSFSNFSIKSLSQVGDNLAMLNNSKLQNVTFVNLQAIAGSLIITDARSLQSLSMPVLQTVAWNVSLTGHISAISMPALTSVEGPVMIESDENISDLCNRLHSEWQTRQFLSRSFICGGYPKPSPSTAAKAGIGVGVSIGVLIIGVIVAILCIRRKRRNEAVKRGLEHQVFSVGELSATRGPSDTKEKRDMTTIGTVYRSELPEKQNISELGRFNDKTERHELPEEHGRAELDSVPDSIQGRYELDATPKQRKFSFGEKDELVHIL